MYWWIRWGGWGWWPVLAISSSSLQLLWRWGRHSQHSLLHRWWWRCSEPWKSSAGILPYLRKRCGRKHQVHLLGRNQRRASAFTTNKTCKPFNLNLPELGLAMLGQTRALFIRAFRRDVLQVTWRTIIRFYLWRKYDTNHFMLEDVKTGTQSKAAGIRATQTHTNMWHIHLQLSKKTIILTFTKAKTYRQNSHLFHRLIIRCFYTNASYC